MKIGILTHQYIYNYGAFLQAYALQEKLKELYPNDDIYMINYINIRHLLKNTMGWFRYNPKKDSIKSYFQKIKLPKIFSKTQKKYFNLTKKLYTTKQLNKQKFDVIIVGSDEVWHYEDISKHPMKFGYGLKVNKLLSYAPSTGSANVNENIPKYVKEGLKNFTGFSARDDNAELLIKNVLGKKVTRVLDPTLLYEFPEYKSEFVNYIKSQKFILMYYCDNLPEKIRSKIIKYAKENEYKIFGAGEYKKWFDETFVDINPFEWIEMFKHARIIFTGTFHGVIFSIKSKNNFYCYLTNPSRIKKVNSILNQFEINDRIINEDNFNFIFDKKNISKNINYNHIYKNINKYKLKSIDYLKENIGD